MKLTRQKTSDMGTTDIFGKTVRSGHWGQKHYFIIENAGPVELEAIEDMLEAAGWESDGCPCYEDGFTSGFHIDIDEVDAFKADYKRLKGEVAARITANTAKEQGEILDAMSVEEVELVARVARKVAQDLRSKRESLSGVRSIGIRQPIMMNPYHTKTYCAISQQGWELIHAVLMVGGLEDVISGLYKLEHRCEVSADNRYSDNLTPEQRAIQNRREGMDIYGEKFAQQYAKDYDEAWSYELKRNQAIRDEEVQLTTQIEFNKRQYIWEEVYSEEYKAIRLEVAHGIALAMDANYASADQMAHEFLTEQAHAEALPMTATEAIRHMANTLTRHMEQSELPGFDADAAYGDIKANFDEVAARCNDRAITVWLRNHLCFGYMGDTYTFNDVNKPYRDQFTHILNTSWRPEESATLTLTTIFEMDWWGAAEITVTKRDGDKVYGTASVTDTEGLYQIAFEWLMDMGEDADRVGLPAVVSITGGEFILPNEVSLQRDNGTPLDVVETIQEMDCVLGLSADIINEVYDKLAPAEEAQGK